MTDYSFVAIIVQQPIGIFYSSVIPACIVRECCETNTRRITDPLLESREGIQRILNKTRINEIKSYISTADASFPNSIILNLKTDKIISLIEANNIESLTKDQAKTFLFNIKLESDTFSVIDGQHRLFSFDENSCKDFYLPITFFIDLSEEDKA